MAKCPPECKCGKHSRTVAAGFTRRKCPPGCTCKRHDHTGRGKHPEGCECGTHNPQKHPPDCRCKRHIQKLTAEELRSRNRERARQRDPAQLRIRHLKNWYGLSPEDLGRLFGDQDGRCYACDKPISLTAPRGYAVDHDHTCCPGRRTCGKCILGLACDSCNRGFGQFGDDPILMVQAASRRMERMRRVDAGRW